MINLKSKSEHEFEVFWENGVKLGEIYQEVDGFFIFEPEKRYGGWSSNILRTIADKMDEINKPWNDEIDKYFNGKDDRKDVDEVSF